MPRKNDNLPADKNERAKVRLLKALDKEVAERGKAELASADSSAKIVKLASELRNHGVSQAEVTKHVQVMDLKTRKLRPISRQALYLMTATYEGRLKAKTTRAARRGQEESSSSPCLNAEAFR
jgi:hypothetical protein